MLLDHRHHLLRCPAVRIHDSLATECADLRATDVEHIRESGNVFDRYVGVTAHESVAETCAVEEERKLPLPADLSDRLELRLPVERAVLRWMADVDHAREHHVIVVAVRIERCHHVVELRGIHLTVVARKRQDLVPCELDGTRLMTVDMTGLHSDHTLVHPKRRIDHRLVRLRATGQEKDFRLRMSDECTDLLLRTVTVDIGTVARQLLHIRPCQCLQHLRMTALCIITCKIQHDRPPGFLSALCGNIHR